MDQAYLVQFAGSAGAIAVLALAAAWARIPRKAPLLDETTARAIIEDEEPDVRLERVWVDAAGLTAVGKAGGEGVVLFRVGDSFAVRLVPWTELAKATVRKGRALIRFHEIGAPLAAFQLTTGADRPPFAEALA